MDGFGGIEAGGTKFVCGFGTGPHDLHRIEFPTTSPQGTIHTAVAFFRQHNPRALGVASFGPIDLDPASPRYGFITTTPKEPWRNVDLAGELRRALDIPIAFDTDVNGAALGEARWGAAQGLPDVVYLTVGTGIGGGAIAAGRLVHGLIHPEMGHLFIPRDSSDPFEGCCPSHGVCWEGLASGTAIARRWGQPAHTLPSGHPAWALEAKYLALGLANIICTLSPRRVILGGGVLRHSDLLPMVQHNLTRLLNGYLQSPAILDGIDSYVVAPLLGANAGVLGAIALAQTIGDGTP